MKQRPFHRDHRRGAGTRLWPRSRSGRPKTTALDFGQGESFIRQTYRRVAPLTATDRLLVITGPDLAEAITGELPELDPAQIPSASRPRRAPRQR